MTESKPSHILELRESAGYSETNNNNLSDFHKLFNGLAWCIPSVHHPRKVERVDDIVDALKLMGCPHALQPTQIEDFDYACIYPAVQWIVSLVKTQHQESNDENERKDASAEMQVLKERIEEAGIGGMVQSLVSLLKKSRDLERKVTEFQSDYNSNYLRLQSEITKMEEVSTSGNAEKDLQDYFDCSISDLSNKLKSAKKELSCKLRELVSLKRQLDELPVEAELVQYEHRFSELNVHMQDRHRQTRKYYETYNALLEMKDLMLKETSLLNSVDSQFGDAIGNPNGRAKLNDSMEACQRELGRVSRSMTLDYVFLLSSFTATTTELYLWCQTYFRLHISTS